LFCYFLCSVLMFTLFAFMFKVYVFVVGI